MGDGLEHLSKQTRERAFILARNAKSIGIPLGAVRFTPHLDYMSYYLTKDDNYIIIFCTPNGYLVELWVEKDGEISSAFLAIKNIRHFLQYAKREGFRDIDVVHGGGENEQDLRGFVEGLDEGE